MTYVPSGAHARGMTNTATPKYEIGTPVSWQYPTVEGDGDWHEATVARVDLHSTGIYYVIKLEDGDTTMVGEDEIDPRPTPKRFSSEQRRVMEANIDFLAEILGGRRVSHRSHPGVDIDYVWTPAAIDSERCVEIIRWTRHESALWLLERSVGYRSVAQALTALRGGQARFEPVVER